MDALEIKRIVSFLKRTGIWFNYDKDKSGKIKFYCQIIRLIIPCMFVLAVCMEIKSMGITKSIETNFVFPPTCLVILIHVILCYFTQKQMETLINHLAFLIKQHRTGWPVEMFQKYYQPLWKFVRYFCYNIICFNFLSLTAPMIVDTIQYLNGYRGPPLIVMNALPLTSQQLGYRSLGYYALHLLFIIPSASSIMVYYVGTEVSLCLCILYSCAELKIFKEEIKMLSIQKSLEEYNNLCFKKLIKRHNQLLRLGDYLRDAFGFISAFKNMAFSFCICLSLITVTSTKNLFLACTFGFCTLLYVNNAFMICYLGSWLESEADLILDELYNLPWYEMKPSVRNFLNMMILQAKRPFLIHYKRKSPLHLRTFMQILNTSYSYYMLMRQTLKEK